MKKIIGSIIAIIGIILVAFGINAKTKEAAAISIIGGADGPTSVFIAGKLGDGFALGTIVIGAILIVAGVVIYRKLKKK